MSGFGTYKDFPYKLRKFDSGNFWYYTGLTPDQELIRKSKISMNMGELYWGETGDSHTQINYNDLSEADQASIETEYQLQEDGKAQGFDAIKAIGTVVEATTAAVIDATGAILVGEDPADAAEDAVKAEIEEAKVEEDAESAEAKMAACMDRANGDPKEEEKCQQLQSPESVLDTAKNAARWRLAEQCYLLYNMTDLAIIHAASMATTTTNYQPTETNLPRVEYNKTHMLNGHGGEIMSKLTMIPGTTDIMHATPAELSSLQPLIRLFKINYTDNGEIDNEIEFDFLTHHPSPSTAASSYANPPDHKAFTQDGRRSVGIKSFDWQYIATNPDTIRNDIDAKLVLYFQSFDELIVQRNAYDSDGKVVKYRYLDLLIHAPNRADAGTEGTIDDNAGDTEGCSGYKTAQEYDSSFYEVQVQVGWAPPAGSTLDSELLKSIKHNRTSMFLSLMDHEFDIREDGTYTLTINYKARLDGILSSPKADVLLVNGQAGDWRHALLHQEWMALEERIKELKESTSCTDGDKKVIADIKEEVIQKKDELRADTYRLMLARLQKPATNNMYNLRRTNSETGEEEERSVIYQLPVKLTDIQLFVDRGVMGVPEESSIPPDAPESAPQNGTEETESIENDSTAPTAFEKKMSDWFGWDAPAASITRAELNDNLENVTIKDNYDPLTRRTTPEGDPIRMLNFFYLGELIDTCATAILRNTPDKYQISDPERRPHIVPGADVPELLRRAKLAAFNPAEVENIRILLGPLEYRDAYTQKNMSMNLADVPISLNLFIDFFHRKVIKPQKESYSFVHFIRDIVKELVIDALGDKCFYGVGKQRSQVRIGYAQGTNEFGCDPVVQKIGYQAANASERQTRDLSGASGCGENYYNARLNMHEISLLNSDKSLQSVFDYVEDSRLKDTYQYVVLYTQGPGGLEYPKSDDDGVAEEKDAARGIHHLHIGRDRGILKKISFSKTDAPALREARMEQERAYNPLVQLSNVYEAEVTMFGNTLFYPGSYVYLNPFGLGNKLGIPSQRGTFANIMGLGGYNLITEVSSYIEPGKYETKLKLRFDTSGDGCRRFSGNEDSISDCPDEAVTPVSV
jgi:hypothetical protein